MFCHPLDSERRLKWYTGGGWWVGVGSGGWWVGVGGGRWMRSLLLVLNHVRCYNFQLPLLFLAVTLRFREKAERGEIILNLQTSLIQLH